MKITRTWWGERFLTALEKSLDAGRLSRGRAYASPTRLIRFAIKDTHISAHVKGNANPYFGVDETPYYDLDIQLKPIPAKKWQAIVKDISNNTSWLSRLLTQEMPDTIEQAFAAQKVSLLPDKSSDLITDCNCPDWSNPCKHIAGAYYKVASMLDRDPLLLFQLRGMDKAQLHQALAKSPLGQALLDQWQDEIPTHTDYADHLYTQPSLQRINTEQGKWQNFWQASQPLPQTEPLSDRSTTPAILIKKGGDYPAFWDRDNSFIEAMEALYCTVQNKNKQLL